jgi:hypothetical protein
VSEQWSCEDRHGRHGKQTGGPARQDAGAQRRDAKQQSAEDIPDKPG